MERKNEQGLTGNMCNSGQKVLALEGSSTTDMKEAKYTHSPPAQGAV